jgi:hypothetical protein
VEVDSATGLLNKFGWGAAEKELQIPESTDSAFGKTNL